MLGEPSFKSLADLETPSGISSFLSVCSQSQSVSGQADPDLLSSTTVEGTSASISMNIDQLNVSSIPSVLFCTKCAKVFQE